MPDRAAGATEPLELTPGVFSTSGLPAARRVELWESHNAAALIGLTVRAPDSLDAAELNVRLPRARLARVTGTAHAVERSRDLILRTPADSVVVFLTLRGEARFAADGGTLERRPGDALAWETDRPFTRTFARGLEELVVTVPWAELTARSEASGLPDPVIMSFGPPPGGASAGSGRHNRSSAKSGPPDRHAPTSARIGRPDQYARALARIAARATRAERPLRPDEPTVLDLVAAIAAGPRTAPATAHRAAARSYIEECLTDPNLGAAEVAAAAGLSERQLSRLFAADGGSVPRHILARRLELAYAILSAPLPPTVADAAAASGFTSATYFSHAFRQRFGHRASDLKSLK
ncbi:MAG TPA: helix-turn-helix transcriptional regulator [Trebonia sp.]|jgi:AraC-like DNA-binding protein|nr:helix-turn-helix transcriptional regulator [Trebonia sp.]